MESSVFVAVRILGGEGLAAAEAGGGDDDGTRGIVDCVVATANAVAGGFDLSEKRVGFRKHKERGENYSNRRDDPWISSGDG